MIRVRYLHSKVDFPDIGRQWQRAATAVKGGISWASESMSAWGLKVARGFAECSVPNRPRR